LEKKVALANCNSYDTNEVFTAVCKVVNQLGGINAFIKPGERILIKPNLLSAKAPERAITTHPEVVRALIRLVRSAGAIPIVGDSSGGAIKGVERVWVETGMKKVCHEENTELVNFETSGVVETKINHKIVKTVYISKVVLTVDGIINAPKLKTHGLTTYTGAVKNFYGTIPGLRKAEYHKLVPPGANDFGALIGEIFLAVENKVRLNVIDAVLSMEGNGPSAGEIKKLDFIAGSNDANLLDYKMVELLGFKPKRVGTIKYIALQKGYMFPFAKNEILGDKPDQAKLAGFKFPSTWFFNIIPRWFISILGRFVWLKAEVIEDICTSCLVCVNSCPVKAIEKKDGKKPFVISKNCISCLCCHEMCPSKAIAFKKSFLAKFLIRG